MQTLARLKWACRRGMLELDVILMPFVENHYAQLDEAEQATFQRLLAADDPDLYAWFMGHQACDDADFGAMIKKIHSLNGAIIPE